MDTNKVFLTGVITETPNIVTTQYGVVTNINLAVTTAKRNNNEECNFINCTLFAEGPEKLSPLQKNVKIFMEGRVKQDRWEDKNTGAARSKLKVLVENYKILAAAPVQQAAVAHTTTHPTPTSPTPPPPDTFTPQQQIPQPSLNLRNQYANKVIGFKRTGALTWQDLLMDRPLVDGDSGRAYLNKLAHWDAKPEIANIAKSMLMAPPPTATTQIIPEEDPEGGEPPF